MNATSTLMTAATFAQKELVVQGKVSYTDTYSFDRDALVKGMTRRGCFFVR